MAEITSGSIDQLENASQMNSNEDDDSSVVNKLSSFSKIRNKFEQKSKPTITAEVSKLPTSPPPTSEFQKLYSNFKAQFTKRQFAATENCFNTADKNQNGFLEPKEIKALMENHQQSINLCDAEALVSMGDHDQDGKLSPKEFLELCKPAAELLQEQHHMEASSPVSEHEFIAVIIQKLRGFINPINVKVKGTLQYFEIIVNMKTTTTPPQRQLPPKSKSQVSPDEACNLVHNVLKNFQQKKHCGMKNEKYADSFPTHKTVVSRPQLSEIKATKDKEKFDFDLILIGSCFSSISVTTTLKARNLGKRVALVRINRNWDQLETRMWRNEEIEKQAKLLLQHAAITGTYMGVNCAYALGWTGKDGKPILDLKHDWSILLGRIQEYLKSENDMQLMQWQTSKSLFHSKSYKIVDKNTVEYELCNQECGRITGNVVLCDNLDGALYPELANNSDGGKQHCITFMQMLYRGVVPSKVLFIGGDGEAVENAGILASLNCDVTVCPNGDGGLLKECDEDMATIIRKMVVEHEQDIKILEFWEPTTIQLLDGEALEPQYWVTFSHDGNQTTGMVFNCVIVSSRDYDYSQTKLMLQKEEKVFHLQRDETMDKCTTKDFPTDILNTLFEDERLESSDFRPNVIAFSHYEYAWIGYTNEEAALKFGSENLNVYDSFTPGPEWAISRNTRNMTAAKVICLKAENDRITGLHFIGPSPNAREMIQGFALSMKLGATRLSLRQLDCIPGTCGKILSDCVGI